jgi:hypothetical protein
MRPLNNATPRQQWADADQGVKLPDFSAVTPQQVREKTAEWRAKLLIARQRRRDGFFGTDDWKECVDAPDPRTRNRCLHDLYLYQLHLAAGAEYVRSFEMSNERDVTDYYLFYATNELLGLKKMKEAMWKADESGEFRFSDATDPKQLVLFEKAPHLPALEASLLAEFSGADVSVREIERFVLVETAFRETHYKGILKVLERDAGLLKVINAAPGRRAGTFGDPAMVVRFG